MKQLLITYIVLYFISLIGMVILHKDYKGAFDEMSSIYGPAIRFPVLFILSLFLVGMTDWKYYIEEQFYLHRLSRKLSKLERLLEEDPLDSKEISRTIEQMSKLKNGA